MGQAQTFRDSGRLRELQNGMFDCLERFFATYDSWHLGVLGRRVPTERKPILDNLVLYRDEFDVLRDLYQQGFEHICRTLRFGVAAQNTVKRGNPDDFGDAIPARVPLKSNPGSMTAFDKIANAWKIEYVRQVPGFEGIAELLNNRTRNSIGHASARHDLRTGRVVSDTDPTGMTYMQLVGDVFGIFEALAISAQVLRSQDVMSSPDFNIPRPPT